jgi:hypothetical protein
MAKDLDEQVHAFLLRPIEQAIPYLFVNASYYKIQDRTRYVTKAVFAVAGVRESPTVRTKSSGQDCLRVPKNEDSPGFNWSS